MMSTQHERIKLYVSGFLTVSIISLLCFGKVEGVLLTSSTDVAYEAGDRVTITCQAKLRATDTLILLIKGSAAYIAIARALNDVFMYPVDSTYSEQITYELGEISTDTPPDREVTFSYTIHSVNRTDAVENSYACQHGTATVYYNITVYEQPRDVSLTSSSDGVVLKKKPVFDSNRYVGSSEVWELKVSTDISNPFELELHAVAYPAPVITWYKEDFTVRQGKTIMILRDEPEELHNGLIYRCTASNNYGEYTISIEVQLQYKPRPPTIVDDQFYPAVGGQVNVICMFDAEPVANVFYLKQDPTTNQWNRIENEGDSLYIADVKLDQDVGAYKCEGSNSLGSSEGIFYVHGKPRDAVEISVMNIYDTEVDLRLNVYSAEAVTFTLTLNYTDGEEVETMMIIVLSEKNQFPPHITISYTLRELDPNTYHLLQVVASNEYGSSDAAETSIITGNNTRPIASEEIKDDEDASSNRLLSSYLLILTLILASRLV